MATWKSDKTDTGGGYILHLEICRTGLKPSSLIVYAVYGLKPVRIILELFGETVIVFHFQHLQQLFYCLSDSAILLTYRGVQPGSHKRIPPPATHTADACAPPVE